LGILHAANPPASNVPPTAELVDPTIPARSDGRRQYRVFDWFATFPDLVSCFNRRAYRFNRGKHTDFRVAYEKDRDLEKFIRAMSKSYATAPNYADVLMSIIKRQDVQDALYEAKEALGKSIT